MDQIAAALIGAKAKADLTLFGCLFGEKPHGRPCRRLRVMRPCSARSIASSSRGSLARDSRCPRRRGGCMILQKRSKLFYGLTASEIVLAAANGGALGVRLPGWVVGPFVLLSAQRTPLAVSKSIACRIAWRRRARRDRCADGRTGAQSYRRRAGRRRSAMRARVIGLADRSRGECDRGSLAAFRLRLGRHAAVAGLSRGRDTSPCR
jgi:hypothetical protein